MSSNFFLNIGTSIEGNLVEPAQKIAISLSEYLLPLVASGLTIWIMVYGLAVVRGEAKNSVNNFVWQLTKISVICSVAIGGGIFQSDAFALFNEISNTIYNAITNGAGGNCPVSSRDQFGIYSALDCASNEVLINTVSKVRAAINDVISPPNSSMIDIVGNIAKYILDLIVVVLMLGLTVIGSIIFFAAVGLEVAFVRITLAMVFAISPIFIFSLIFEPTKPLFKNWLHQLYKAVLTPALFILFTGFALSSIGKFIDTYLVVEKYNNDPGIIFSNLIYNLIFFVILLALLVLAAFRIPGLAGELTGTGGQSVLGMASNIGRRLAGIKGNKSQGSTKSKGGSIEG